ncbi:helix-turn-helix transcriptional regulator [Phenylobacterium sp.]|jgi:transcriptional regulator with XRE-family HTH domain|uniref:helix-turn-helix domain-containing protein n=1 Tax=Phenylobacterium sp. TaxID=1871053 RepID=UPI002E346369|nr:helix-turn-helix transcriptional regulator [Phenylobacterium sp.]HEX4710684.1 helix-turn-helix transcriptional regulator [Phenylobacterium sp.]
MDLGVVVGRNIRALREQRGMAQDALAHEAGIHVTYLSGVENGRRNITLGVLERIARSLDVPETTLVDRRRS